MLQSIFNLKHPIINYISRNVSGASDLAAVWVDIYSLYMNAAQHMKPEIRLEGIHGFLTSARSLSCEARSEVYELLCTCVKQEDSSQVRWVTVKLSQKKIMLHIGDFFYETSVKKVCRFIELLI